ncbi:hypothetical protein [Streptomyces genisteinicus]|uniref:Uncharacterized protein n=1 Tax=Streptomyces genisteinicus TaxID=2768068 RepID=A0A7H0I041_9ACTN|nr:hypothetical protein [Streptomyces genisteinicus]QNP66157.1 hypothetical protein IAG43_26665 [Streptomyces genisteinicus]
MAETWDGDRLAADGFERVHVELEWYDGPRAGLADIGGRPHYFHSDDHALGHAPDAYEVWPASGAAMELEREQWAIYARWNARREAGEAGPESHPGHGGVDARYDELESALAPHRRVPEDARRLVAEHRLAAGPRRRDGGPRYWLRWRPAE